MQRVNVSKSELKIEYEKAMNRNERLANEFNALRESNNRLYALTIALAESYKAINEIEPRYEITALDDYKENFEIELEENDGEIIIKTKIRQKEEEEQNE